MEEEIPASAIGAQRIAVISSLLIILLIIGVVLWYFFRSSNTNNSTVLVSPTLVPKPIISISPHAIVTDTISNNVEIYTSEKFGITFRFFNKPPGADENINISEEGNKIYVYPSSLSATQGQFIEKFTKSTAESLDEAIRSQILAGKDPNRCLITTQKANNIIKAEITFPSSTRDSMDEFFADSNYCSKDYAQTNGLRYFMYDVSHPDKYYFISIGQYPIIADENTPWQETIEIIN